VSHIETDPNMSIKEAARRRDFTFNTLAKDPLTGEIFDAFGGMEDLRTRTLKVTDEELFQDDPLRVMRGAQFVARLGLRMDPDTLRLMQSMVHELKTLPKERMEKEWDKLLLKPERPSMGLQALFEIGVIHELYPELADLKDTEQEFDWHPEGDVWNHTLMVVDAARNVVKKHELVKESAKTVMLGALCHDLGKPATTVYGEDGRITSRGHEPAGEEPTREFLSKLGISKKTIEKVVALVRNHLVPSSFYMSERRGTLISNGAFRRLALRLKSAGTTIEELTYVADADNLGRGPYLDPDHTDQFLLPAVSEAYEGYKAGAWMRKRAKDLNILLDPPKSLLRGKELIQIGFKPGPKFGKLIQLANEGRDSHEWTNEKVRDMILNNRESIDSCIAALEEARVIRACSVICCREFRYESI